MKLLLTILLCVLATSCATYVNLPLKVSAKLASQVSEGPTRCQLRLDNGQLWTAQKAEYCQYEVGQEIK